MTKLSALESYDDINFSAVCEDRGVTRKFTLKIHNGVESANQPLLDAQNKMMAHLGKNGCVCPQPIQPSETTKDCRDAQTSNLYAADTTQAAITFKILPTLKGGQTPLAVRLLTWVHGVTMSEVGGNESTLEAAGAFLGSMATALLSFDHPALHREHAWDIRRTLAIREFIPHIIDERRRSLVLAVLRAFESEVLPYDVSLPRAVIMGDFNDANIILDSMSTAERPRVSGVIDFGDAVHTWRINELAIGMAYSMVGSWGKRDGHHLRAAQAFFRGYRSSSTSPQLDPTEVMIMKAEIVLTSFACYFLHHH